MSTNPPGGSLDERIAAAEIAGDHAAVRAVNAEKLDGLFRRNTAENAARIATKLRPVTFVEPTGATRNPGSTDPVARARSLDEQIAEATAGQDWPRLNALNAQKLARLGAERDATTMTGSGLVEPPHERAPEIAPSSVPYPSRPSKPGRMTRADYAGAEARREAGIASRQSA